MRLITCPGCRLDYMHESNDPRTFRCTACHEIAHTEERDGVLWSFNMFKKVVDRKPIRTGPRKAGPTTEPNLGYTVYSGFGVK